MSSAVKQSCVGTDEGDPDFPAAASFSCAVEDTRVIGRPHRAPSAAARGGF